MLSYVEVLVFDPEINPGYQGMEKMELLVIVIGYFVLAILGDALKGDALRESFQELETLYCQSSSD